MQNLFGKLVLIIVLVAGCAALMYPPKERLNPGTDLAGGTTVTYQVLLREGQDAEQTTGQIIEVWKNRLDPTGVRNITFQRIAGNRIQITMAAASEQVQELRNAYIDARNALASGNLNEATVAAILRKPPAERDAELARKAGDNTELLAKLKSLAAAYDRMIEAREPYYNAQAAHRKAESELRALEQAAEPDRGAIARKKEQVDQLLDELQPLTRAFINAEKEYLQARGTIFQSNIDLSEVDAAVALLDGVAKEKKETMVAQFKDRMGELIKRHPQHAERIAAVRDTYLAYDAERGPYDDPNDMIRDLEGSGVLEFRLAAQLPAGPGSPGVPANQDEYRTRLEEKGPTVFRSDPYAWFPVDEIKQFVEVETLVRFERQRRGLTAEEARELEVRLSEQGLASWFVQRADEEDAQFIDRVAAVFSGRGLVAYPYGGKVYVLLGNDPSNSVTEIQENWSVARAYETIDENHFPAVGVELDTVGGSLMSTLSGKHRGELLCITLDKKLMNAATIQSQLGSSFRISGGSGGFTRQEISYLTRTLAAGTIDSVIEGPISVVTTTPQFGEENLRAGLSAAIWALIAVAVFMAVYYLFCGLVADFALAANVVIILGVMSALQATFTLPGIAGIILTIGMAVDANVLIFERIREEIERKVELQQAVRLGFEKAFSTIIDANVTTLITCVVLYYRATVEVKGFALTLMIGIIASMFTALFCSRALIETYMFIFKPKALHMLPTVVEPVRRLLNPNIQWTKLRPTLFAASLVVIVVSLGAITLRGADILDIEFRGGTQVTFNLKQGQAMSVADARNTLSSAIDRLDDEDLKEKLGQARLYSTGDANKAGEYDTFTLTTVSDREDEVEQAIANAFESMLAVAQPIPFDRDDQPVADAPIWPILPLENVDDDRRWQLGAIIDADGLQQDVRDFAGGIAIKITGMASPLTVDQLRKRLDNMRIRSGRTNQLPPRKIRVVGLDLADTPQSADPDAADKPWYDGFVVLVAGQDTNYIEDEDRLFEAGGMADQEWKVLVEALTRPSTIGNVTGIDGSVSETMKNDAILAMVLSLLAVVAYIWVRFGNLKYGIAAIAALVHDVTVALGFIAATAWIASDFFLITMPFRLDLAMVAAMLTIVGYSLNDTIVVFDRIRENRGKLTIATPPIIDESINQTISRTALTSFTTILALTTLYTLGGPGVHGFAFAMLVGVVVGTYSSVGVAANVLLVPGTILTRVAGGLCVVVGLGFGWGSANSIAEAASNFGGWAMGFFALVFAAIGIVLFVAASKMEHEEPAT